MGILDSIKAKVDGLFGSKEPAPSDPPEVDERLYVGAKARLDEATLKTFQAHLKSHYGLEKMELLAPPSGS